ncbi:MAG: TonB-dependent receptor [Bacteroidota bacterium]
MKINSFLTFLMTTLVVSAINSQVITSIDTIYVQAGRIPMKSNATGRNVSVVTPAMIGGTYATSLDDLLQYIPGIEVQTRNAFGAQGDITMRGSTFTQVLILVDGMRLNDPLTSHFNSNIPVAPSEIARIEVYRGAASAMYGADAVGGVINVITKTIGDDDATNAEINLGQHRLVQAQTGFSRSFGNSYFGGGFSLTSSDGEPIPGRTVGTTELEPYNNYFDNKSIGLSYAHRLQNGWTLQARSAYDDRDFSARYFYTTSTLDKSTETTRNWWNQLRLSQIGQKSTTEVNMAYRYNTDVFVFSPDFPSTNRHVSKLWNLNVGQLRSLSPEITLRYGLQADHRSIVSNDRGDHADLHLGAYGMTHLLLTDELNATASLRVDYDENYDVEITPQLNVAYRLPNLTLRAAAGRSIRAADYTERYVSFNLDNLTPGRSLGNPDLNAERSWSQEIGADISVADQWMLRTTAFFRQSDALIDFVNTNASDIRFNQRLQQGENYFFAQNVTSVNTSGFEVESWLTHRFSQDVSLDWVLGYTHVNTTNEENTISVYISSHARHLMTNQLTLRSSLFDLSLTTLYKARNGRIAEGIAAELTDDYTVWSGRLRLHLTDQVSGQVQFHNLFDTEYQDILGAPLPGRWFSGGVTMRL